MRHLAIAFIRLYRYFLSPWVGNQCRFYPSCSHYGEQAFQQYGFMKGCALTLWRIVRCNPWHPGGFDYVPGTEPKDTNSSCEHHVHKDQLNNSSEEQCSV